jgi:hypothetical protein
MLRRYFKRDNVGFMHTIISALPFTQAEKPVMKLGGKHPQAGNFQPNIFLTTSDKSLKQAFQGHFEPFLPF